MTQEFLFIPPSPSCSSPGPWPPLYWFYVKCIIIIYIAYTTIPTNNTNSLTGIVKRENTVMLEGGVVWMFCETIANLAEKNRIIIYNMYMMLLPVIHVILSTINSMSLYQKVSQCLSRNFVKYIKWFLRNIQCLCASLYNWQRVTKLNQIGNYS